MFFEKERTATTSADAMQGSYLGPKVTPGQIKKVLNQYGAVVHDYAYDELYPWLATQLDQGKIVGWMQGRMEFGPRALGGRSILADPRKPYMQKKLNLNIKYRESFRPFAPAVLSADAADYFDMEGKSPYMLEVQGVKADRRKSKPLDQDSQGLLGKLYVERSDIPAVTHIDYSARIQTVHGDTNPHFENLLTAFKKATGCSVLINTSFNVRGEPIVCTAEDGYRCFMRTEMDVLVIGNHVFLKEEQPDWKEKDKWQETFTLD